MSQLLIKEGEAADVLSVSKRYLQASRLNNGNRSPGPPFVRIGNRGIRYSPSALEDWCESRTVAGIE